MKLLMMCTALALLAGGAAAQEDRSIRWAEIRVEARLDAEGRLHVREHQGIVFDGDWNGGVRAFETRLGQRFQLLHLSRIDRATGDTVPLVEDDEVDDVDEYDLDDELRWRSRAEDDPPFDDRRLDYLLEYTVANAVLPTQDGYLLDRDFLFPERAGPVHTFELELTFDSAWAAPGGRTLRRRATMVPPGRSFSIRVPLRHRAAGSPATVPTGAPALLKVALVLLILGVPLILGLRFFRREREEGRYEALPQVPHEGWLKSHLFRFPPEVVGAAWDGATSAAEVAGLLARLVAEGKLASHVEEDDDPVLHLELRVPRESFSELERPLIDALFFDGRESTDTRSVREHYEGSGFDPAGTIRKALERRVEGLPGRRMKTSMRWAWVGVAVSVGMLVVAAVARPTDAPIAALVGIMMLAFGLLMTAFAHDYSRSVVRLRAKALAFALPGMLFALGLAAVVAGVLETTALDGSRSPYYRSGGLLLIALTALGIALTVLVLRFARSRDQPERLRLRRRLAAARAFFQDELEKPEPALRDEWFPYLLAFGLGPAIDNWFQSFGGESPGTAATAVVAGASAATSSGGGMTSSSWTGGGATFGGGGGFSGGGVGGSWATAAATVASGVSTPGGTAGGVASSGGGAGGGW